MNLVNCKAGEPSNEPKKKKKMGEGCLFTLVCNAFGQNCTHTFSDAEQTPRAHWTIPCLSNPHYSSAKKGGGELFRKEQTNSCPFCNSLVTSTCQTRGSHPPRYKRYQVLPTLKVARVAAGLTGTILLLWGPASNAPPTCLQLVFPGSPLHSRNRDRFLLSHWAQSLDKVLSSCLPSSLSFKYLKKIVFF